jgi:hypothetical protein
MDIVQPPYLCKVQVISIVFGPTLTADCTLANNINGEENETVKGKGDGKVKEEGKVKGKLEGQSKRKGQAGPKAKQEGQVLKSKARHLEHARAYRKALK